jgi:DNA invertase Pin-like site-specific DNA recombinase
MKAVAYCRVSTTAQGEDGVSLDMQRDRIAAWCVANGYDQEAVFVETMSAGRAANRPELLKAIALACKVRGVLVVFSLSRLARSVKDTLLIAERLEKASANLASLTERIDTNSALGKMVFRLLSTLNEFEKDQLSERTESAMSHLRRSNRRISARIPMGYDLGSDGETLLVNPREQQLIERIHSARARGLSYAAIAQSLQEDGVATKAGGRWYPSTVKAILDRQKRLAA